MAMEITSILLAAQSQDGQIRTVAEGNLKQFQEQNLPHFLLALSIELSNEQKPPESRRLAGILLKNSLDAKDSIRKEELAQKWISVDLTIKFQVKESLLKTLGSSVSEARRTSSQVIAKVASIEIPRREWQDLIAKLLNNMTQKDSLPSLKEATLETLGYVCEEISPEDLEQDQVNAILTAVVQGMNQMEHSFEVRLAGIKALYNALDFAQTNFQNEIERNYLMKQEEDQDQDDNIWNLSMAGGTCLGLVARNVGDAVVPLVMPFVQDNITKADWRNREAATFAFGSILEGPSVETLLPLVHAGLNFLLNAMKDQNTHVKDTTAWALGRIFEILHSPSSTYAVITDANLPQIMSVLLESIRDVPNVAEKVCGAIYFLVQGYEDDGSASSVLTPYLADAISALLSTADRMDTNNSRLRASAYETVNEIVRCSSQPESLNMIAHLMHEIMKRLSQTLELQISSSEDKENQSDLQALLCGVLQVIIQKLSSSDAKSVILQSADQMMILFLRVFGCRSSSVHEEAMLAIGALAYATGPEFAKYMPEFYNYLEMGLQNFEEYQVCSISVGVVGDICRALDEKILPFCNGIMSALLKDLSNSMLHRSVKPPIFSCFGDIALAIGEQFEKYLPYAVSMLQGAAGLCTYLDVNDEDMVDYGNQLRRGIFEAYSGILQGFKNSKAELLVPYASQLLQFTEAVFKDKNRDEGVTRAAVAMLGDLADTLGPNTKLLFRDCTFHSDFLGECFESDDEQLKETATWTQGMIRRVLVS
ncbi:Importin subunit beta-1 [Ananas comosus]|uniref:Importin subunit beta-1 n=1 Tax=Ananas comosus TaxID=4615 RepID=A0A199VBT4_ANACO|nr:Importin subunit beta-1 [Ananas comosus]